MAPMQVTMISRPALLVIALALSLTVMGCAQGPLGSHGVDYIPAFDAPYQGKG